MATPTAGTVTVAASTAVVYAGRVSPGGGSIQLTALDVGTYGTQQVGAYRAFQRNASNQADVRIVGTYSYGGVTQIQYRWGAGAWQTLVATPTGGAFDATVTLTGPGQGNLEVRLSADVAATAAATAVSVTDVYVVAGQSNNVGQSINYVPPVAPVGNPTWVAPIFDKANVWRPNVETSGNPFDNRVGNAYPSAYPSGAVQGSYFGRLATLLMADGIPAAFLPCAVGATTLTQWAVGGVIHNAMLDRVARVGAHKAVIWYQGESDAGQTQSWYETRLNAIMNHWATNIGTRWLLVKPNTEGLTPGSLDGVRAAYDAIQAARADVYPVLVDMLGAFTGGIHYDTAAEINEVAARVYTGLTS